MIDRMNSNTQDGHDSRLNHLYGELAVGIKPEIHLAMKDELQYRLEVDQTFEAVFPAYVEKSKDGLIPLDSLEYRK